MAVPTLPGERADSLAELLYDPPRGRVYVLVHEDPRLHFRDDEVRGGAPADRWAEVERRAAKYGLGPVDVTAERTMVVASAHGHSAWARIGGAR